MALCDVVIVELELPVWSQSQRAAAWVVYFPILTSRAEHFRCRARATWADPSSTPDTASLFADSLKKITGFRVNAVHSDSKPRRVEPVCVRVIHKATLLATFIH